jgi:uncharacterized membrane protein
MERRTSWRSWQAASALAGAVPAQLLGVLGVHLCLSIYESTVTNEDLISVGLWHLCFIVLYSIFVS